ncbi:hypothetical protein STCU_12332 [Strigomonas culicis]|uniref:Vesicle transport protein n=1 Tax=Strigomonas culicis TaxID=28005 RepID=S9TFN9_9TRYP|nr:hypothetical protein STCU_12332 [Strigomonas culicis]|eukprot:EPY15123.1 hypothetical protein STCU_12332 [Strigomonas culicis]
MASLVSEYIKLDHLSAASKMKENLSSLAGGGDYSREERDELKGSYESASARDGGSQRRGQGPDGGAPKQEQMERPLFCFTSLSYNQRLIGFLIAAGIGFLFCIFSWVTAFRRLYGTFAFIYTVANVLLLLSTTLLCSPLAQVAHLRQMHRLIPLILFVILLIVTYIVALVAKIAGLVVFLSSCSCWPWRGTA